MFLLASIFLASFCVAIQAKQAAPQPPVELTVSELLKGIESRSENLTYISETDAPVHAFISARTVSALSHDTFIAATNKPPVAYITDQSYRDFFAPQINHNANFQQLKDFLENNLTSKIVYRVWLTNTSYDLFAVGLFPADGNGNYYIVGVQSYGVAT